MVDENNIENFLVEFLHKDSIEAFNTIYSLYAKKLLLYVSKATRNKEDAEEIVHDIFISLWKNRKSIQPETNLSTFLFSIAYKRRIDFFRQSLRTPIHEDYTLFQNELSTDTNSEVEYRDFLNMFNQALSKLPYRLRSLLVMAKIDGMSIDEIASKMNISQKTVRNEISLGLKLLKGYLTNIGK